MKKLILYGYSDDIVEVKIYNQDTETIILEDEIDVTDYGDCSLMKTLKLEELNKKNVGVYIYVIYDGCWSFAVGRLDEDIIIPKDWIIETKNSEKCPYSSELIISNLPDNIKLQPR